MRSGAFLFPILMLMSLAPSAPADENIAAADAEASGTRAELIRGAIAFYNEQSEPDLFAMTSQQLEELMDGAIIKIRRQVSVRGGGETEEARHERLTAYYLVEQPIVPVWCAALDAHFQASDLLTEVRLQIDDKGNSQWYQHVDLPWPVNDRHWVIDLSKALELCESSGGLAWEHAWRLARGGPDIARATVAAGHAGKLTSESTKDAVYLPVNQGAWVMFALDETRTLIAYHLTAAFGGRIPEGLVNTFAMAQLDNLLREVAAYSLEIPQHYDLEHEIIYAGDGTPVPRYPARSAE